MQYVSTRGGMAPLSFSQVLMGGLAPDGGLVMPAHYPEVDNNTLDKWRALSYADLAFEIFSLYCDDIAPADLQALCKQTYTADVFGSADITPVSRLAIDQQSHLNLLHLSNGPTLAFKDIAMQMLGSLFEYVLARDVKSKAEGEHVLNILGATSGDTGSAAQYAMRGRRGIKVFMLSPARRMSAFQTAQMFSLQDPNIFNIAVDGVFDTCQDMVKAVSNDAAFKAKYHIGTVNSINWGRVLAQVVYYFKAYFAVTSDSNQRVSFAVPSGNFGNVCAGHVARMMGLPIRRLVLATNENNVLHEFFSSGHYRVRNAQETYLTSSPSMDISKASNFERFVFDLVGREPQKVGALWKALDQTGSFDLSAHQSKFADYGFVSGCSTHANRLQTIASVYRQSGYTIDTHTADGIFVAQNFIEAGVPMICLETALPAKFSKTIVEAIGHLPPRPAQFADIEHRLQKYHAMPASTALLKQYVAANR